MPALDNGTLECYNFATMINWGYTVKRIREEKRMTQQEVADAVGVTRSSVARYEAGDVEAFTQDKLGKFAKAFGMTIEQLTQEIYGKPAETTQKPALPPLGNTQVNIYAVPIYTQFPFHAGDDAVEQLEHIYREQPKNAKSHIEGYVVRGTCLTPIVNDGDIIIVDREAPVENGDIVACMIEGKLHIAKLKRFDDQLWLENRNGKYKIENCLTSAKVIEVVRRL